MKRTSILSILLLAFSTIACARNDISAATSTVTKPNEQSVSPVYSEGKCHFRIGIFPKQGYSSEGGGYTFYDSSTTGSGFPISCKAGASQDEIDGQLGAKQVDKKWISGDFNAPFTPDQNFHFYKFVGANWTGSATTYDQITGEETTRQTFFQYCLVENHGPQVLCGNTTLGPIGTEETAATLPRILAVLKTFEFVDPPATSPASAPSQ